MEKLLSMTSVMTGYGHRLCKFYNESGDVALKFTTTDMHRTDRGDHKGLADQYIIVNSLEGQFDTSELQTEDEE